MNTFIIILSLKKEWNTFNGNLILLLIWCHVRSYFIFWFEFINILLNKFGADMYNYVWNIVSVGIDNDLPPASYFYCQQIVVCFDHLDGYIYSIIIWQINC